MELSRRFPSATIFLCLALCMLPPALAIPSSVESVGTNSENASAASPHREPRIKAPENADSNMAQSALIVPDMDDENNVYFEPGAALINDRGRKAIFIYAKRLKSDPRLHVVLRGYPDHVGSLAYNLARSQGRVDAVERALEGLGVPSYQIRQRAYGLPDPDFAECTRTDCRHPQRRVDLVLSK